MYALIGVVLFIGLVYFVAKTGLKNVPGYGFATAVIFVCVHTIFKETVALGATGLLIMALLLGLFLRWFMSAFRGSPP
jgi:hypothetical protein